MTGMDAIDPDVPITISTEPVRKVIKRSSRRADGYFYSRKMRRWLPGESKGERAFLRLAELDPQISEIYAQPLRLPHRSRHGVQTAYPDFAIKFAGEWEIHEVKDAEKYSDPITREKLYWVGRELELKGFAYSVTLSDEIKPLAFSPPIEDLLRRLPTQISPELRLVALRVSQAGPLTIRDFLSRAPAGTQFLHVEALIAQGHLWTDIRAPLSQGTVVHAPRSTKLARLIPFKGPIRPHNLPRTAA